MALSIPGIKSAEEILEPTQIRTAQRGKRLRSIGWFGVLTSVALLAVSGFASWSGSKAFALAGFLLALSIALINWTRIWVRESKEPFQFTFSVAEFEPGPDRLASFRPDADGTPLAWLRRDLIERLSKQVRRLSLLDESETPDDDSEEGLARHVHVSGWYGLRRHANDDWYLEVKPRVRLGADDAPERMARTIRFLLGDLQSVTDEPAPPAGERAAEETPPRPTRLPREEYERLFERVYWSVASEVYAQIRHGVEAKVRLLPPGRLRAAAYLYEADDYAASNTIDGYDAARRLYRKAQEMYDLRSRFQPATAWRKGVNRGRILYGKYWGLLRLQLSKLLRRFGRREILTARAQLGYGRMLVAAWHLKRLGGGASAAIFEAPPSIERAIWRLERLPEDLPERNETLFRARVTMAICRFDLDDLVGAADALRTAEQADPAKAKLDAEFLMAGGLLEDREVPALRLLASAVERDPSLARARYEHARLHERLLRKREVFEPAVANAVDEEYASVLAIDPANVSAWANRAYVAWLLSSADPGEELDSSETPSWRRRAVSSLKAGREYKDVRAETMVGELDWNLARVAAEEGRFSHAYFHYLQAVSAMIAKPALGFVGYFISDANEVLVARFDAYEQRVTTLAEAATGEDGGRQDRLIRSVRAFALNDCAMAHFEYAHGTGRWSGLKRARKLLVEATECNPHFALPKYNLAKLCLEQALRTDLKPKKRRANALEALRRAEEAVEIEPEWVLARLRMFDVELQLAKHAEDLFPPEQGEAMPAPVPERWLRPLFPHRAFRDGSETGGKIDASGDHLESLLADRELNWRSEFDEAQVVALARWARLMLPGHPARAAKLCRKIEDDFYPRWPTTSKIRNEAAEALLPGSTAKEAADLRLEQREFLNLRPPAALELEPLPTAPPLTSLATAVSHVAPPERALQVQCREGDGAFFLAREYPRASIRGVDRSERAVRAAAGRIGLDPEGRVAFKVGKPRRLPYPDANFDLVVYLDAKPSARETARVLRGGGSLILAYSSPSRAPGRLSRRWLKNRLAAKGIDLGSPISVPAGGGSYVVGRCRA